MTERYWEPHGEPEVILDWISNEVQEAIRHFWEDDAPVASCDLVEASGDIAFDVLGPDKPTIDGRPAGCYSLRIDIVEELTYFANPYPGDSKGQSDEQREDMRRRAAALHRLSEVCARLAASASSGGTESA